MNIYLSIIFVYFILTYNLLLFVVHISILFVRTYFLYLNKYHFEDRPEIHFSHFSNQT